MASLTTIDKLTLERLFQMSGGYVLNFSDRTLHDFFIDDIGLDLSQEKYLQDGGSKAKRLRVFWRVENDKLVGNSIKKMIDYLENQILLNNVRAEYFPSELIK